LFSWKWWIAAKKSQQRPFDSCFEGKRKNQTKEECACTNESAFARRPRGLVTILEPFRIFFPADALLGFIGVSLWVLYYLGAGVAYPRFMSRCGRNHD
jgi:hypothetical protein